MEYCGKDGRLGNGSEEGRVVGGAGNVVIAPGGEMNCGGVDDGVWADTTSTGGAKSVEILESVDEEEGLFCGGSGDCDGL